MRIISAFSAAALAFLPVASFQSSANAYPMPSYFGNYNMSPRQVMLQQRTGWSDGDYFGGFGRSNSFQNYGSTYGVSNGFRSSCAYYIYC